MSEPEWFESRHFTTGEIMDAGRMMGLTFPPEMELGVAWQEAEAALPEGWVLSVNGHKDGSASAHARTTAPMHGQGEVGTQRRLAVYRGPFHGRTGADGPTPAAALRALAEKLSEREG